MAEAVTHSRLAQNIMLFARTLRAAGLPIGPGKVVDAIEAVKATGIGSRDDFYWTLHAVFVQRREQRDIFDQAFHIFWKNPKFLQRMMSMLLPQMRFDQTDEDQDEIATRLAEALQGERSAESFGELPPDEEEIRVDAALTFSDRELLQEMDFDKMTLAGDLMAMAIAFSAGSLLTGFIADWAGRRGIGLKAVMIGCFVVLGCAELGLVFNAPLPGWLLVTLLGISGSGSNLAYVLLSGPFGPAMAGRAQTSLNLLLFLSAALIQSGIGAALDIVQSLGIAGGAPFHYALVLGLLVVVQTLSTLWFAGMPDARR